MQSVFRFHFGPRDGFPTPIIFVATSADATLKAVLDDPNCNQHLEFAEPIRLIKSIAHFIYKISYKCYFY